MSFPSDSDCSDIEIIEGPLRAKGIKKWYATPIRSCSGNTSDYSSEEEESDSYNDYPSPARKSTKKRKTMEDYRNGFLASHSDYLSPLPKDFVESTPKYPPELQKIIKSNENVNDDGKDFGPKEDEIAGKVYEFFYNYRAIFIYDASDKVITAAYQRIISLIWTNMNIYYSFFRDPKKSFENFRKLLIETCDKSSPAYVSPNGHSNPTLAIRGRLAHVYKLWRTYHKYNNLDKVEENELYRELDLLRSEEAAVRRNSGLVKSTRQLLQEGHDINDLMVGDSKKWKPPVFRNTTTTTKSKTSSTSTSSPLSGSKSKGISKRPVKSSSKPINPVVEDPWIVLSGRLKNSQSQKPRNTSTAAALRSKLDATMNGLENQAMSSQLSNIINDIKVIKQQMSEQCEIIKQQMSEQYEMISNLRGDFERFFQAFIHSSEQNRQ